MKRSLTHRQLAYIATLEDIETNSGEKDRWGKKEEENDVDVFVCERYIDLQRKR